MNSIAVGPNSLRIIEAVLGILDEAGIDRATAAWAVDLLGLYVKAIAAEQSQHEEHGHSLGHVLRVLGAISAQEFPRIHASREELMSGEGLERFEWAIEVLLKGVIQTPRGARVAEVPRKRAAKRGKRV
jgi:hypothetical protein